MDTTNGSTTFGTCEENYIHEYIFIAIHFKKVSACFEVLVE
jgi:hypothetical protein